MKHLLLALSFLINISLYAQPDSAKAGAFVRVYDLEGKKIGRGKILLISENMLELKKGKSGRLSFSPSEIGYIRTNRSGGNNVLLGAATGAGLFAILGVASADPDAWIFGYTALEGATSGFLVGSITGAAIGGITALFKKPVTYTIDGDPAQWIRFKSRMEP